MNPCRFTRCTILALAFSSTTLAQVCSPHWLLGSDFPGIRSPTKPGNVGSLLDWDPDDGGPLASVRVIGGSFSRAFGKPARNLVAWNSTANEWVELGSGVNGEVTCTAAGPGGTLIVGGLFSTVGSNTAANGIAVWNGSIWRALRGGVGGPVYCIATLANGDIVAGGDFTLVDDPSIRYLARWDGAAWSAFGSGIDKSVTALLNLPNGDMIAGGFFQRIGGVSASRIARYDGSGWNALGAGVNAGVRCLIRSHGSTLVAGGLFTSAGGITSHKVARWNGAQWSAIGLTGSLNAYGVSALCELPGGDLIAALDGLDSTTSPYHLICRRTGSTWAPLPTQLDNSTRVLQTTGADRFLCCGNFAMAGVTPAHNLAEYREGVWASFDIDAALDGTVHAMARLPDGRLMVGGEFTAIGSTGCKSIAIWDGARWSATDFQNSRSVFSLTTAPDGTVYAGANDVARWDGSTWTWLPDLGRKIYSIAILRNGDLLAASSITASNAPPPRDSILRWNGTSWVAFGGPIGYVYALLLASTGDLYAAGSFSQAGIANTINIARWNGVAWHSLGAGLNRRVMTLIQLPNGDIVAGGQFSASGSTSLSKVARWDGSEWHPLGSGLTGGIVHTLALLPNGDLLASGGITAPGSPMSSGIARWDGESWHPFGSGLGLNADGIAYAIVPSDHGEIFVGGDFGFAGGLPSYGFARWSETGIPWVAKSPETAVAEVGETVRLSAVPASAYEGVSVRWLRDGAPVVDGPGGASVGGGVVSGATTILESPTDGGVATLTIAGARPSDSGEYAAVVLNECGETVSTAATVRIFCRADFDRDGFVCAFDYDAFVACFEGATCPPGRNADFDRDGFVDGFDYDAFVAAFQDGCS